VSGTKYAVIVRPVSNPSAGIYAYTCSCTPDTSPYAGGSRVTSGTSGATWAADGTTGGRDLGFRVFVLGPYASTATFTSSLKDANPAAGGAATWGNITWNASVPGGTTLKFRVAGSNSPTGPFTFVGPDGTAGTFFSNSGSLSRFNGYRYLRYQVQMTSSGAATPTLNDVTICFTATPRPVLDLNADGNGDVLTYASASGVWKREVTQANGTFVETGAVSNLFNWSPGWVVLPAKFNEDNNTDFFLFNPSNGNWYKMLNDGVSGFTEQASGAWYNGWQRFVMDLDGDGISDIFLYDSATGVWFKCISTPTGFTYTQGGWNPNWEITPMTLDGDALGDMFLFNRSTGRWFWVLGQLGAGFTYPASTFWTTSWNLYPGDFNADGLSDLLLHDTATGQYYVAMNNGAGTGFTYTTGYWVLGWTPYVGDLDADGDQDLFLHKASNGAWFELLSNGAGGFTDGGGQVWTTGWNIYLTDLNGDKRTDILLYNPATGVWYQCRNLTIGTFTYTNGTWATNLTIVVRSPFM
ncbi:MAG: VCBS repeat-containing protein, partial [Vicinamibacterales bacterium]